MQLHNALSLSVSLAFSHPLSLFHGGQALNGSTDFSCLKLVVIRQLAFECRVSTPNIYMQSHVQEEREAEEQRERGRCVCVCCGVRGSRAMLRLPFSLISLLRRMRNSKELKTSSVEAMFAVDSHRVLEPNRFYVLQ